MNKTRRLIAGLPGVALAAAAPRLGHAQETTRIRFAHSLSTTEPAHLAAEFFAKNVAARTGNKVQIIHIPTLKV